MTDKQFRYELRLLGLRGHNENTLRLIVDGLSRQLPVRQISQSTGVTEKTITKMKSKAGAIAGLLSRREGNATSNVNEKHNFIYNSDHQKPIDSNRRR